MNGVMTGSAGSGLKQRGGVWPWGCRVCEGLGLKPGGQDQAVGFCCSLLWRVFSPCFCSAPRS